MNKKGARQTVFVCISINEGKLLSKIIPSDSVENASSLFFEQEKIKPQEILGPFYKKRTKILETTRVVKFGNISKKAIYDNWMVNALYLKEPENHAFLIFLKRIDDKKVPAPTGTVIVPIADLRIQ